MLVVPRGLSVQPYNLDSVRLASSTQPGCQPAQATETFVMFHFPVTQCGTTVQVGDAAPRAVGPGGGRGKPDTPPHTHTSPPR